MKLSDERQMAYTNVKIEVEWTDNDDIGQALRQLDQMHEELRNSLRLLHIQEETPH